MNFADTQASWSRRLVASLLSAGVRNAVVSPGSRSTPLVLALSEVDAELTVTIAVDERSAGFLALGQARITGRPTLLVCTSGSAAAHYFPALVEASEAALPLLVLTADRPPELQQNRAPQTLDQLGLFGSHVRGFFELGLADDAPAGLEGLARKAAQAVALARGPHAGPVHLNFKARKPLEFDLAARPQPPDAHRSGPRVLTGRTHLAEADLAELAQDVARAKRPVLVVGAHAPFAAPSAEVVGRFLDVTGWPLVAEPISNLRQLSGNWDGFDLSCRALGSRLRPDLVLQLGDAPTSGAWADLTAQAQKILVTKTSWPDAHNTEARVVQVDAEPFLQGLGPLVGRAEAKWRAEVSAVNAVVSAAVQRHGRGKALDELVALTALCDQLQSGELVTTGNSLAVRVLDTVWTRQHPHCLCASQRGLNGIDGLIAGAIGAATVHSGRSWLVLGDVSFLHDVGSLQLLERLRPALGIVVLNNRGGQIFSHLPLFSGAKAASQSPPKHLERWTTPSGLGAAKLAAAFGIESAEASSVSELNAGLSKLRQVDGPGLLEIHLPPSGARLAYQHLSHAIQTELP